MFLNPQCLCTFHTISLFDRLPLLISCLLTWHHSRVCQFLRSYILPISFGFVLDFKFYEPADQMSVLASFALGCSLSGWFYSATPVSLSWVKKCPIVEDCEIFGLKPPFHVSGQQEQISHDLEIYSNEAPSCHLRARKENRHKPMPGKSIIPW